MKKDFSRNAIFFQKGFAALYITILVLTLMLGIALSISFLAVNQQKINQNIVESAKAYYAAEAGLEDAVFRIKNMLAASNSYSLTVGQGSTQITITGSDVKTVDSLGTFGRASRKVRVILSMDTVNPQFYYGVQVGEGGLSMANNTAVNGNLYSDGSVQGATDSVIAGDVIVATGTKLGEKSLVQNQEQVFGQSSPVLDLAQQFSPNATTEGSLAQASFYIKKIGNPNNVVVRILTDSGDAPTKTVLASATLQASTVGASFSWVPVSFSSPANLSAGEKYWLMIDTSANPNHWVWGADSDMGYGNGIAKYSQNWNAASPVWSAPLSGDLAFKTFVGGQTTFLDSVTVQGTARANTITDSKICGDAYYQSIDASSLGFLNNPSSPSCNPPLTSGTAYPGAEDPPVVPMPITQGNITDWEQAAQAGGVYEEGSPQCAPTGDMELGPARLNCDWVVENSKVITIKGPVWVNGNITLSNNVALVLDSSFGNDLSSVVIADAKEPPNQNNKGQIITQNNVAVCGTEGYDISANQCNPRPPENKSYIMLLSTYSGPGSAINIENNVEGAIFYASNGAVRVSNNVAVKEVTAYKIELEPNAAVTYESGLFDAKFSLGPGASFEVENWKEVE